MIGKNDFRRLFAPNPSGGNGKTNWIDWIVIGAGAVFLVWLVLAH
jgi:hypothetical protein